MLYLTYYHGRNIFRNHKLAPWIQKFKSANFVGFECGSYFPTISISLAEFIEKKDIIPSKNLIRVKSQFTPIECLVYNVRNFENEVKEYFDDGYLTHKSDPAELLEFLISKDPLSNIGGNIHEIALLDKSGLE
jgi:hypothetical protein